MSAIIAWSGKLDPAILKSLIRAAKPYGDKTFGLASSMKGRIFTECHKTKSLNKRGDIDKFLRNHNSQINKAAEESTCGFVYISNEEGLPQPYNVNGLACACDGEINDYGQPRIKVLSKMIADDKFHLNKKNYRMVWIEDGMITVRFRGSPMYCYNWRGDAVVAFSSENILRNSTMCVKEKFNTVSSLSYTLYENYVLNEFGNLALSNDCTSNGEVREKDKHVVTPASATTSPRTVTTTVATSKTTVTRRGRATTTYHTTPYTPPPPEVYTWKTKEGALVDVVA